MKRVIPDDIVQPFQVDPFALRGRLVRLGPAIDHIIGQHDYPPAVAVMLAEAITLAATLADALKYDGVFTLQTKGDGPIGLMVADVTTAGAVRGYAQFDGGKLERALAQDGPGGSPIGDSVPRLLGAGYLAFTVDQGEHTDRYQGIVELQGATLADCAHHYFRQSEQIQAGIKVAVGQVSNGPDSGPSWRAGGLMIQRLPDEGGLDARRRDAEDEGWRRAMILMSSSTKEELLDPALAPNDILFRLFHEDGVRVYQPHPLVAKCRCSRERIELILRSMPAEDIADMKVDDSIVVTCQFCSAEYRFDDADLAALRAS